MVETLGGRLRLHLTAEDRGRFLAANKTLLVVASIAGFALVFLWAVVQRLHVRRGRDPQPPLAAAVAPSAALRLNSTT
jgi:hypothetical protein